MASPKIGVINWDCSLPPETFFGYYQTRTLSPRKYRTATPYYARVKDENHIEYRIRTQEEFDLELQYAIDCGIDYFAYVFYPNEGSRLHVQRSESDVSHKVYELNYARTMHQKSVLRDKIGIASIVGAHPFSQNDLKELADTFRAPYYEKIEGRPLVYTFGGLREEVNERLTKICKQENIPAPFLVPMYNEYEEKGEDFSSVDALSAYACCTLNVHTYGEHSADVIAQNRARLAVGKPVIPLYSVGWDPSPRIDIPSPWVKYPDVSYARFADREELLQGAEALARWIKEEAGAQFAGHILTFAWNEFEEGGWICPTYDEDCRIDRSRLDAFAEVVKYFKRLVI